MTRKTESRLAIAFALAAALSVAVGVIGVVLPANGPAPAVTTLAANLPN